MTTDEFDTALSDLETRVDRLRALYENWFRGYEKTEPSVARKEVERRVYALRKELPRNTALRFRYHQLYLRYTSLATYWQRTARQIEDGTHKLQLQRLRRRNQRADARADERDEQREKREDGPRHYELDLDESLNVDDLLDDLEMEEVARALEAPGPHSEPPPPPPRPAPRPVARSFARHKREESLPSLPPVPFDDEVELPAARAGAGARRGPAAGASEFPDFPEPPTAVREQPVALLQPKGEKRESPLAGRGEAPAREGRRELPLPPSPAGASAALGKEPLPAAPKAQPGAAPGRAAIPAPPSAGAAKPAPAALGAPAGRAGAGPTTAERALPGALNVPPAGRPAPAAPGGTLAGRPAPAAANATAAGSSATAAGKPAPATVNATAAGWPAPGAASASAGGRPAPTATGATGAGRSAPGAPTATGTGQPAPGAPSATAAGRPAPGAASPTAAGRPAPGAASGTAAGRPAPGSPGATGAGAPAAPNPTRPGAQVPGGRQVPIVPGDTIVGRPPLTSPLSPSGAGAPNEQRLRRIYDEYTAARRRNNEGEVRYEVMVNSIQKMLPELAKKHQGRPIDFEVVVKDGRVGLKPKAT